MNRIYTFLFAWLVSIPLQIKENITFTAILVSYVTSSYNNTLYDLKISLS